MGTYEAFSQVVIEAEYQRLGHRLGWRLLTCPMQNIETANVAMITLNPGGYSREDAKWSVEGGSAYEIEGWKGCAPGNERLQRQVRKMFELMNVRPMDVLSGYLVPFRSPSWSALPEKSASLNFGCCVWRNLLSHATPQTVIAVGKHISSQMVELLRATDCEPHPAGWGGQTIDIYRYGEQGKLIVLPHLSRFALFNRSTSEQTFHNAVLGPKI